MLFSTVWNLHCHQQCTRVSFSPHLCQICCVLLDDSHSDRYEMIFHCGFISLHLISDVKHLFRYQLAICISSSGNCLFILSVLPTFSSFLNGFRDRGGSLTDISSLFPFRCLCGWVRCVFFMAAEQIFPAGCYFLLPFCI